MDVVCKICSVPAQLLAKIPGCAPLVRACCTTVGQKLLMALTGLSLVGFLVAHLAGNLFLLSGEHAFNEYAEKLHSLGPILVVLEIGLFAMFLLHIGLAISTAALSQAARSLPYDEKQSKQSGFVLAGGGASNWMIPTGIVILLYLVLHIIDMKFNVRGFEGGENKFEVTRNILHDIPTAVIYVVSLVALGVHLTHGISSAFQTLGISHPRWNQLIRYVSVLSAWAIAFGFIVLVIWAHN